MDAQLIQDLVLSPNGFGFRSNTGEIYQLNPQAVDVIGWVRRGDDADSIARLLAEKHGVSIQRTRSDVTAFLEQLSNLNLFKDPHE